jgi:hypothetical protein
MVVSSIEDVYDIRDYLREHCDSVHVNQNLNLTGNSFFLRRLRGIGSSLEVCFTDITDTSVKVIPYNHSSMRSGKHILYTLTLNSGRLAWIFLVEHGFTNG